MKCKTGLTFLATTAFFLSTVGQTTGNKRLHKAIICLTYDDGLETQLSTVIPQLDSAGFKATFFLNSIQGSSQSSVIGQTPEAVLGWTNAASNGHELANHTLFHPCPEKLGWAKSLSIDTYTVDQLLAEISTQNKVLSLLDPKRKTRAFAFPCNNTFVGGTDYSQRIKEQGLVTFGRVGGDSSSVVTDFKNLNRMQVPSWHVWTGTTLEQLIAFAQKVQKAGGLGIYQFHGVGGNVFSITPETHRAFLAYLKSHQNEFRIIPFSEAMESVTEK